MGIGRLAGLAVTALLLASLVFFAGAYWLGSRLVAPVRSQTQAIPGDLPARRVSLESSNGTGLSGWFLDSDRPCGTVVLMHAVGGDKRSMVPRARFLAKAGYAVFLFDFRAHGESSGEFISFGHFEQNDATAALRFVAQQRSNRPIAVIGFSLGGVAAVLNGPELKADALVLEAVYTSYEKAVLNRVRLHAGDLGALSDFLAQVLLIQFEHRFGIAADQLRPIDRIATLGVPVFVIAGSEDRHTTPQDSLQLFEEASEPKRFWLVEGAGHVDFYRQRPQSYEEKVLGFLADHMPCR